MAQLEDRIYKDATIERLFEIASFEDWHLDKAHAMYELAHRALNDSLILDEMWEVIRAEMKIVPRMGPPLSVPAARVLLDSSDSVIESALAKSMSHWDVDEQELFFQLLFSKDDRKLFFDKLMNLCDFQPKVEITDSGEIATLE